ncbi:MAG TPA: hypothetical protein VJT67_06580 [Longimicrobiaceae bacterium]|nr:hypothetical protein [Longimicrobiaceae bacterium]
MKGDAGERPSADTPGPAACQRTSALPHFRTWRLLRSPAPPEASPEARERLAKAERMIDLGWAIAVVWAVMRLVGVLWISRATGRFEAGWLIDPLLILLLAYGLYRRSRVCAGLLLAYVVVELWLAYHVAERPAGIGVALALELAFLTGLRGTVLWHREPRTA